MERAARKAGGRLRRDFGEIEHLQVSRKGPADFVSKADQAAERTIWDELKAARPDWGFLFEEAGDVAGKLHTGRSRNDQVATDFRLWGMGAGRDLERAVAGLGRALLGLARRGVDVVLPGYTHLQQGQPIRAAQWALAHFFAFARDADRLAAAKVAASVLPLGSGAIAGCPFPIDREMLRRELGFVSSRRRSRHRLLAPRGSGHRRRWNGRDGRASQSRLDQ